MRRPDCHGERFQIYQGDCRDVLAVLPEGSIESCITDSPYHLTQVSRKGSPRQPGTGPFGRHRLATKGFMGAGWDGGDVAFRPETWAAVLRVLKPGGFLLAFGGTRTFHRLMCAIEDAGFEIRDVISWLYGQGFPKSHDIAKAMAKASADAARRWNGWNTALKPAWEAIIVAMKPLDGTFVANALKHGVAGLHIDGARIQRPVPHHDESGTAPRGRKGEASADRRYDENGGTNFAMKPGPRGGDSRGRWPANVVLQHAPGCDDSACAPGCPVRMLDAQSGVRASGGRKAGVRKGIGYHGGNGDGGLAIAANSGGASRFFFCSKASPRERSEGLPKGTKNSHSTVKPVALMEYLCRLTMTPTGGTVLDPFMGSGTTGVAALRTGRRFIGIEKDAEAFEIAKHRIMAAAGGGVAVR